MKCPECNADIPDDVPADTCFDGGCGPELPVECEFGELVWERCVAESDTGIMPDGHHICACGWVEPYEAREMG